MDHDNDRSVVIDLEGPGKLMRGVEVLEVGEYDLRGTAELLHGTPDNVTVRGTFLGRRGTWADDGLDLELSSGDRVAIKVDDVTVTRRGLLYRILVIGSIPGLDEYVTRRRPSYPET